MGVNPRYARWLLWQEQKLLEEVHSKKCHFDGIKYKALLRADEVFITQTSSGIIPVVEIDGHKIGDGKPGPVTRKLMQYFKKLVWGK